MNGDRMYALLEKLNFVRASGSEDEARAAEILKDECAQVGVDAQIETFATKDGEALETEFEVLAPYQKTYAALGYARGASVDAEAPLVYAEDAMEANLTDVKGKIILINGGINKDKYELLIKSGAACVVVGCGTLRDADGETDIARGFFRPELTDKHPERLAAVTVRAKDLYEMLKLGANRARVHVRTHDFEGVSRNVTALIPGTRFPEQVLAFTAHFDSVPYSHGIYDNAAGSAIMMEILRHFAQNPPMRTLRFVWTGSEERGLLGSNAFVCAHAEEIENTRLCVNLDLAGSVAGHNFAIVTGPEPLKSHIDMLMKQQGFAVEVKQSTYSSDCIPFADKGVPAVSIGRFGAQEMSYIHNRHDLIDYVSAQSLANTGEIALMFACHMDSAKVMPFPREMPDDMKKKIDEYLKREKKQ